MSVDSSSDDTKEKKCIISKTKKYEKKRKKNKSNLNKNNNESMFSSSLVTFPTNIIHPHESELEELVSKFSVLNTPKGKHRLCPSDKMVVYQVYEYFVKYKAILDRRNVSPVMKTASKLRITMSCVKTIVKKAQVSTNVFIYLLFTLPRVKVTNYYKILLLAC